MRGVLVLLVSGCAIGAPPGFSSGDRWVFPLLDPLDDGRLVTPLYVEGQGPYLVVLDPDAPITTLDNEVLGRAGFRARGGPRAIDEQDVSHPTFYTTATNLRLGDLAISERTVRAGTNGAFNSERRRIYGVIGRDVIADSIVFGFDRERGIAWLETQQAFKPPPEAQVLEYFKGSRRRPDLVVRRLVTANLDGASYDMHLDLVNEVSQLREEHWKDAKLQPTAWKRTLVDEVGSHREVQTAGIADRVTAGGVTREHLGFVAYGDRRWNYGELEGALGLDFFRPFSVVADWHHERYYLTPRRDGALETSSRLARWGTQIPPSCRATGCATLSITSGSQQLIAEVKRDPAAAGLGLEVTFGATSTAGAELPRLTVSLPPGADRFEAPLEARYDGATVHVLDVSPYPFNCDACIVTDLPLPP